VVEADENAVCKVFFSGITEARLLVLMAYASINVSSPLGSLLKFCLLSTFVLIAEPMIAIAIKLVYEGCGFH
jgi:hypothetical protein